MTRTLKILVAIAGLIAPAAASAQIPPSAGIQIVPPFPMLPNAANAAKPTALVNLDVRGVPGAAGDGVTDDSAAFTTYFGTLPTTGAIVYLGKGSTYRIAQNLTIPSNTILDCGNAPGGIASSLTPLALNTLGGIRLGSTATITMSPGSRLQHCPILLYGLTWPQTNASAYAGTAINWAAQLNSDVWLIDDLIVGFNTCVDTTTSSSADRLHLINVECDGVNGYKIGPLSDISEVRDVRAWPWGTVGAVTQANTRSGVGFQVSGPPQAGLAFNNIFDFGHSTGLKITTTSNPNCCGVVFNGLTAFDTNNISVKIAGTPPTNPASDNVEVYFSSIHIAGANPVSGTDRVQFNGAGKVHIGELVEALDTSTPNCVSIAQTQLYINYAQIRGCAATAFNITDTTSTLHVKSGWLGAIPQPMIKLPVAAAGMGSDAVEVNVDTDATANQTSILYATGSLLPQFSFGDPNFAAAGIAAPQISVTGLGQTTSALAVNGNMGGTLLLNDSGSGAGHGGALLFGSNQSMETFAALKGQIINGATYSTGTVELAIRANLLDTAMTKIAHWDNTGYYQVMRASTVGTLAACGPSTEGAMQPVTDATTNTWGATVAGGGANHVLAYCDGTNWTVMAK